jgi:hypothetical protein
MHSKHARHLMEDVIDNNGITGIHGEHLLKSGRAPAFEVIYRFLDAA